MEKQCTKCTKNKNTSEFYKEAKLKDGFNAWCKVCSGENAKKNQIKPSNIFTHIKYTSKKRNLEFCIDKSEFIYWYESQPQICHYCLLTFEQSREFFNRYSKRLTIDRKNNSQGYTISNIVLACYTCNCKIKFGNFTYEDMKNIGQIINNRYMKTYGIKV
jgi:hypothetical protein